LTATEAVQRVFCQTGKLSVTKSGNVVSLAAATRRFHTAPDRAEFCITGIERTNPATHLTRIIRKAGVKVCPSCS
jgi:hypothetical protein